MIPNVFYFSPVNIQKRTQADTHTDPHAHTLRDNCKLNYLLS